MTPTRAAGIDLSEWMEALEARHFADLTFSEVARSLRALSATYVERRSTLATGAALSGAGKRAAFALFYGPLHFLLVRHVVAALSDPLGRTTTLVDLGCGTGASGAGFHAARPTVSRVVGIDRHPWAIAQARDTWARAGLRAVLRVGDLVTTEWPAQSTLLLSFAVNELPSDAERATLLQRLQSHRAAGGRVLVVEPLAGFVAPWWGRWASAVTAAGGRMDEWRLRADLPPLVAKLDRAAGLDHRELTGRSLCF